MSRIDDGHATTIAFSTSASGLSLYMWEKEVTPPGMSMGGENDTTTMRNSAWRTKAPKQLRTLTPCTFSVAYDPAVYDEMLDLIGVNQSIEITFPDDSTLTFWGWIDEWTPGNIVEGEQPVADITIIPSNQNASQVETAPQYAA